MKKDFVTFYHERLDYFFKKNMAEGIKGLRGRDFLDAQKETSKFIKNSSGARL